MNDSMKELEKRIKISWPTHELSKSSQQTILYNIKMMQKKRQSKFNRFRKLKISYGICFIAAIIVGFVLISPMLERNHDKIVDPKPLVKTNPSINDQHPTPKNKSKESETYFPQKFPDKDTVFIDENTGWKLVPLEGGGMHKEAIEVKKTTDSGKTWKRIMQINGQENSEFLSGLKAGITFINKNQGWIAINLDPDPKTPYLLQTRDGGKSWAKQYLPIPKEFNNSIRNITRPVFFSPTDGITPIFTGDGQTNKLLYMDITHDGGKTWIAVSDNKSDPFTWDFSDVNKGTVSYKNKKWYTTDLGQTWSAQ